jgi:hypothetical protein
MKAFRDREEQKFDADGFQYRPKTGEIWKDGERRDYSDGLYRSVCCCGVRVLAHRLAWRLYHGEWPANLIDHRNLKKQDNCLTNLREATYSQNEHNKPANKNSATGERGVYFDALNGRWKLSVRGEGRRFQFTASHKVSAILASALIRRELARRVRFQGTNSMNFFALTTWGVCPVSGGEK